MTTRLLLTVTALLMAFLGTGALFLPDEILVALGISAEGVLPVLMQLLGAHYLGFAALNWMARNTLFGGIYNRPAAMGNFGHFAIGALVLVRAAADGQLPTPLWIVCACYVLFAAWFGFLAFFSSPVKANS